MTPYEYKRVPVPPNADGFLEVGLADWLNLHGDDGWELVQIQEFDDASHPVATFKRVKAPVANRYVTREAGPIGAAERDRLIRELCSMRSDLTPSMFDEPEILTQRPRKPERCPR